MKSILFISLIFLGLQGFSQEFLNSKINDSIKVSSNSLETRIMLQGGYNLLGIIENGENFQIKELNRKKKEYWYKYYSYRENLEDNKEVDEEIEIIDIPITKRIDSIKSPEMEIGFGNFSKGKKELQVFVDPNQTLNMPIYTDVSTSIEKLNGEFKSYNENDQNQKRLLKKYYSPEKELNKAFPLFIYNSSDSIVKIDTQEGWLFIIQEALDSDGKWKPIEYHDYETICGISYGTRFLIPNFSIITKIYVYSGDYLTKLRVKLMTNNQVYYSNEFIGSINKGQYIIPSRYLKKSVKEIKGMFFTVE